MPTYEKLAEQMGRMRDQLLKIAQKNTQTAVRDKKDGRTAAPSRAPQKPTPATSARPPKKQESRPKLAAASRPLRGPARNVSRKPEGKRPVPEHLQPYVFKKGRGK